MKTFLTACLVLLPCIASAQNETAQTVFGDPNENVWTVVVLLENEKEKLCVLASPVVTQEAVRILTDGRRFKIVFQSPEISKLSGTVGMHYTQGTRSRISVNVRPVGDYVSILINNTSSNDFLPALKMDANNGGGIGIGPVTRDITSAHPPPYVYFGFRSDFIDALQMFEQCPSVFLKSVD